MVKGHLSKEGNVTAGVFCSKNPLNLYFIFADILRPLPTRSQCAAPDYENPTSAISAAGNQGKLKQAEFNGRLLKKRSARSWHNRSVNKKSSGFDYSSISKISSRRPEKKSATRLNSSSSAISSKY